MVLVNSTQDIYRFLNIQCRERYRTFVLHGLPLQGKTHFARRLSERYPDAVYLDLLHEIVTRPPLAAAVDLIEVQDVLDLVVSSARVTQAKLLLVDEIDFLLHTWSEDLQSFKWMIEWLSCTSTPACIGFVLQTRPALQGWNLTNTYGQSRILALEALSAL